MIFEVFCEGPGLPGFQGVDIALEQSGLVASLLNK